MGDAATVESTENDTDTTEPGTEDSPEVLGEKGIEALRKEREAHKAAEAARKQVESDLAAAKAELEKFQAAQRSELQNAQYEAQKNADALAEAKNARAAAEAALLRYEVAQEKGITGDALDLLIGSTREELESRADSILKISAVNPAAPIVTHEGYSPAAESDLNVQMRQAFDAAFKNGG